MRNTKIDYRDITFGLKKHPPTKDIATIKNESAVKQSIKNLVMMERHDKPFHPEINGGVSNLLFEPINDVTSLLLVEAITLVVSTYESRVSLIDVMVEPMPDRNLYQVTLMYTYLNQIETQEMGLILERLR